MERLLCHPHLKVWGEAVQREPETTHTSQKPSWRAWQRSVISHVPQRERTGKLSEDSLQLRWKDLLTGTSPAVQWLRLHTSPAEHEGLIPGWGTYSPHITEPEKESFLTESKWKCNISTYKRETLWQRTSGLTALSKGSNSRSSHRRPPGPARSELEC